MAQLLQVGDVLDKYRVERCLGIGGMGEVYLVSHVYLKVQRAMKILRLDVTEQDPTFRDRFVREARIAARFQHPNSIGVVDVESESESGFLYLVMEYVEGQSLQQYLKNGVLAENQALHICREVAKALDVAWREMQLVHRDIKPGNIMITTEGAVKLADLGIAKAAQGGSGMTLTLTMEGTMIGTPEYASPEQCMDASQVDTRADIYSLGATMYEMLTGIRPYRGSNAFEIVEKVINESPKPLREWNPDVSRPVASLVERMMSKNPKKRPQTMGELIDILDGMLSGQDPEDNPFSEEMLELIRQEAAQKAEQLAAERVKTIQKRQSISHVIYTLAAILFVVGNIVLGNIYVRNKSVYEKKIQALEEIEAKKLNAIQSQGDGYSYSSSKTKNRRYVFGMRYSADGKELFENVLRPGSSGRAYIRLLNTTERVHPGVFRGHENIIRLSVPVQSLPQIMPMIPTFKELKDFVVNAEKLETIPGLDLPPHVRVRYNRITVSSTLKKKPAEQKQPPHIRVERKVENAKAVDAEQKVAQIKVDAEKKVEKKAVVQVEKNWEKRKEQETALLAVLAATKEKVPEKKAAEKKPSTLLNLLTKTKEKIDEQKRALEHKTETKVLPADLLSSPEYKKAMEAGMRFSNDGRTLVQVRNYMMKKCHVPEGVEYIHQFAFAMARNVEKVILPSTLKVIKMNAFRYCSLLRSVQIPNGLERIEPYAFMQCKRLKHIELPESLKYIGNDAFVGTDLRNLYIPSNVSAITGGICSPGVNLQISPSNPYLKRDSYGAIYNKVENTLIAMTKSGVAGGHYQVAPGTQAIGQSAFYGNNLARITLPSSLTRIGFRAFYRCKELTQLNLPAGLQIIQPYTFTACSNLSLTIPASVHEIGFRALCEVKTVSVARGNRYFFNDPSGAVYDKKNRKIIFYPANYLMPSYSVVKGAQTVGASAFENCRNLQTVTLSSTVRTIEMRGFYGCADLKSVEFPSGLERIGAQAFAGCTRLNKVVIPRKTKIERGAFEPYVKIVRKR